MKISKKLKLIRTKFHTHDSLITLDDINLLIQYAENIEATEDKVNKMIHDIGFEKLHTSITIFANTLFFISLCLACSFIASIMS